MDSYKNSLISNIYIKDGFLKEEKNENFNHDLKTVDIHATLSEVLNSITKFNK